MFLQGDAQRGDYGRSAHVLLLSQEHSKESAARVPAILENGTGRAQPRGVHHGSARRREYFHSLFVSKKRNRIESSGARRDRKEIWRNIVGRGIKLTVPTFISPLSREKLA